MVECEGVEVHHQIVIQLEAGIDGARHDSALHDTGIEEANPPPPDTLWQQDAKGDDAVMPDVRDAAPVSPCTVSRGATLRWLRSYGDSERQTAGPIHGDSSGGVIAAGWFGGRMSFGGPDLIAPSNNDTYTWIAKLDSQQGHVFSKSYDGLVIEGITSDALNDVFFTGSLYGTVDFGGGSDHGHIPNPAAAGEE